ncbi:MAG: TraM recognition domain-containing protein, partial [Myxococcales bacterium]|nr:TraM recognition domain-containing protein [Myxococcales bacterium]
QRSIERRAVDDATRPVFLWADEAQNFVSSYDQQFATTCRGARVALVYLTQNCSNFVAALGGSDKGRAETDSLFANLNTKILHANGDPVTNQWAATLIGRTRQHFANSSASHGGSEWVASALGFGQPGQQSAGMSESYEFAVQPGSFSELRTGGPENSWQVDAVLFQSGKTMSATGRPWMPVTFDQRSK